MMRLSTTLTAQLSRLNSAAQGSGLEAPETWSLRVES
jgi:hypothetical protein